MVSFKSIMGSARILEIRNLCKIMKAILFLLEVLVDRNSECNGDKISADEVKNVNISILIS